MCVCAYERVCSNYYTYLALSLGNYLYMHYLAFEYFCD